MAAGLTIEEQELVRFREAFDRLAREHFKNNGDADELWSDGDLSFHDLSLENAEALRYGAPWGQGFAAPLFDSEFEVLDSRVVGERHLKMTLSNSQGGREYSAIAFGVVDAGEPAPELSKIHALYQMDANEFRGRKQLQLVLEYFDTVS